MNAIVIEFKFRSEFEKVKKILDIKKIPYRDADEYGEEYMEMYQESCDCDEPEEPVLLVDAMKEDLWEKIKEKYTIDELEALLE